MPPIKTPKSVAATQQWVNRGDSVFDSTPERLARKVAKVAGVGDPMSDILNMMSPMQVPGAVGLGLIKTVKNPLIRQLGQWGEVPQEALDYFIKRFPRLAQQFKFVMDDTLPARTSARFTDSPHAPWMADTVRDTGEKIASGSAGDIKLNPMIHNSRFGGDSVADSVDSLFHEGQHAGDFLRDPHNFNPAYEILNVSPHSYELNPYENLANISGALGRGEFMRDVGGRSSRYIQNELEGDAAGLLGSFADPVREVLKKYLPAATEAPETILRGLRAPNRAVADTAIGLVRSRPFIDKATRIQEFDQMIRNSPDALVRAIMKRSR